MARAITMPTPPATPCTRRRPARTGAEGAKAIKNDTSAYAATPATSGRRRPHRSLSGPKISWPTASPMMQVVRESCT
jgi:hypothetical protein